MYNTHGCYSFSSDQWGDCFHTGSLAVYLIQSAPLTLYSSVKALAFKIMYKDNDPLMGGADQISSNSPKFACVKVDRNDSRWSLESVYQWQDFLFLLFLI